MGIVLAQYTELGAYDRGSGTTVLEPFACVN